VCAIDAVGAANRITLIDAPDSVALGMSATVLFDTPLASSVIALPLQALFKDGDATFVWLLDRREMTVKRSPITLANVAGNDVVIASGVAPGDTVVTAGVHLLKPGQKVKLLDDAAANRETMEPVPAAVAVAKSKG